MAHLFHRNLLRLERTFIEVNSRIFNIIHVRHLRFLSNTLNWWGATWFNTECCGIEPFLGFGLNSCSYRRCCGPFPSLFQGQVIPTYSNLVFTWLFAFINLDLLKEIALNSWLNLMRLSQILHIEIKIVNTNTEFALFKHWLNINHSKFNVLK